MENNKINEGALTKRVKTLVLQERYEDALKALDEIDISRIRNISILCLVGEVYMGLGRYDEAEQILLRVYEKNPNTRRILDLLTTLYIDKGEYSEAEYYYKEFIGVASRDLHRYILRYRLDKGKGERLSVLIDTLEKLKDYEYIEEWAYELAELYDASGEKKKCIHECDEIVLWFGHGEYVDKAIALKCKLTGEPLPEMTTVEQHRAEEERKAAEAQQTTETVGAEMGIEGFAGADYEGSIDVDLIQRALEGEQPGTAGAKTAADGAMTESAASGEALPEKAVTRPEGTDSEQPDEGMADVDEEEDEIIREPSAGADEPAADETDDKSHIAQLVSSRMFGKGKNKEKHFDWSTLKLDRGEQKAPAETVPEEISEADWQLENETLHDDGNVKPDEAADEAAVAGDVKAQTADEAPEQSAEEPLIPTEGLSQEDAEFFGKLLGTDIQVEPARAATEDADEAADKNAENDDEEDEDEVIDESRVSLEAFFETADSSALMDDDGDEDMDEVIEDDDEDEDMDEVIEDEAEDEDMDEVIGDEAEDEDMDEVIGDEAEDEDMDEVIEDEAEEEAMDEVIGDDDDDEAMDEIIQDDDEAADEVIGDDGREDEGIEADGDDEDEVIEADDEDDEDEDEVITEGGEAEDLGSLFALDGAAMAGLIEDDGTADDDEQFEDEDEDEDEDEISDDIRASDTVMDIFGTVTGVRSIKNQLAKTFTRFEDPAFDHLDLLAPYDINFVVTGSDMSVKSQIAIGIAKALNTYGICDKNKLVRATANDLNARDFTAIFEKLKGGCLIIEGADQLNDQAAGIIVDFVQKENQDVAIVLEGEEDSIKELFGKYPVLHAKFLNIIHIGKYNENELVQLAQGYAKKKGYEMSKSTSGVLKRLLRERMRDGYSVNYEDIMAIIEEAIASLEKRNLKNLFMTVLDNKYEEAAMFELQPEDFDNINIPD